MALPLLSSGVLLILSLVGATYFACAVRSGVVVAPGSRPTPVRIVVVPSFLAKSLHDWEIMGGIRAALMEHLGEERLSPGQAVPHAIVLPSKLIPLHYENYMKIRRKRDTEFKAYDPDQLTDKQQARLNMFDDRLDKARHEFSKLLDLPNRSDNESAASDSILMEDLEFHIYLLAHGTDGKMSLISNKKKLDAKSLFDKVIKPFAELLPHSTIRLHLRSCQALPKDMTATLSTLLLEFQAQANDEITVDGVRDFLVPGASSFFVVKRAATLGTLKPEDGDIEGGAAFDDCVGPWAVSDIEKSWTRELGVTLARRLSDADEFRAKCGMLSDHLDVVTGKLDGGRVKAAQLDSKNMITVSA
eukprot:TRINITY_DN56206_c0_g1_i1.p1 TRINITY_DN56206_c0_g1~~TRINITY_DN56206_c0_g1_i1.p1  ORF type:complete len:359 (-),score=56.82 TRINITY_DN56206_c0_g1_i1:124-1200(-)